MSNAQQPPVEDHVRFLSSAVDWRRIFTGVVIGIPIAVATYYGGQRVTDYAISEIGRRLEVQRIAAKESDAQIEARMQRQVDEIHADIRELRVRVDAIATNRRGER